MISDYLQRKVEQGSWIRKLFEEGIKLKKQYGEHEVFDFSLGNPIVDPPQELHDILVDILKTPAPGLHRYIENQGLPETREKVAGFLTERFGKTFTASTVVMTVGAGGGMNVVMKSILNPGDEVILLTPYFVEYDYYVENHGGKAVHCELDEVFQIDAEKVEACLTPKTKAIILNSPHNPTGTVLTQASVDALGALLAKKEAEYGHAIYLCYDDPYGQLVYDVVPPNPCKSYSHTIVVSSFSKDLGIAGERLGYIGLPAEMELADTLTKAFVFSNRILGFVNAPSFMQRAIARMESLIVEPTEYRKRRDAMAEILREAGFSFVSPDGGIFIFPKTPIEDDVEFCRIAAEKHRILIVPGSGFGRKGYFRLSYSVPFEQIERSRDRFKALNESFAK